MAKTIKTNVPVPTTPTSEEKLMPEKETAITKAPTEDTTAMTVATHPLIDLYAHIPEFVHHYGRQLLRIEQENVTPETMEELIWTFPEEAQDKLSSVIAKMNPNKKGVVSDGNQTDFLEIRVNQGTGNDPNRPEDSVPGQYYLSSVEKIGKSFLATPVLLWEGRQMWKQRNEGDTNAPIAPECTAFDRNIGDKYGHCSECPFLPWRDNKPNRCSNTVGAILLIKETLDLVLLRFQRTSAQAGNQLMKYAKRGTAPWARWYRFETDVQTKDVKRWFTIKVTPTDEKVDEHLKKFCDIMCTIAERDYLYPKIARPYALMLENNGVKPEALSEATTAVTEDEAGVFGAIVTDTPNV